MAWVSNVEDKPQPCAVSKPLQRRASPCWRLCASKAARSCTSTQATRAGASLICSSAAEASCKILRLWTIQQCQKAEGAVAVAWCTKAHHRPSLRALWSHDRILTRNRARRTSATSAFLASRREHNRRHACARQSGTLPSSSSWRMVSESLRQRRTLD